MKPYFYLILIALLGTGCTTKNNSETFIKQMSGRYLFNANEVINIYFKNQVLYATWRGKQDIQPIKVNDSTFYMAEMNEKLIFLEHPTRIELAEKTEHDGIHYVFEKLAENEKTPGEYLSENDFDNALAGYLKIKEKDSLNPVINEYNLNSLGYQYIKDNKIDKAIQILTINSILYPNQSNTFDSLGHAYWQKKDTINAVLNYKKALAINPEKRSTLSFFKKHKLQ